MMLKYQWRGPKAKKKLVRRASLMTSASATKGTSIFSGFLGSGTQKQSSRHKQKQTHWEEETGETDMQLELEGQTTRNRRAPSPYPERF